MSVLIIAEAGVNHNGSMELAKQLVDAAARAGADFIKFQTFVTNLNVSKSAVQAEYQKKNTQKEESQYDMLQKLELSFEQFRELKDYCTTKDIGFLSTGFDVPSIDFLDELGQAFFKIPSGEITNKPLLELIASKRNPVILSTGMADIEEILNAVTILLKSGLQKSEITVLHCNTEYPTPFEDVNLKAMQSIREELDIAVGYSDHTLGIEVPIAATALGATVIEKHFTLDKDLPGPDHKASLNPEELSAMVRAIRNIEQASSGSGIKAPSKSEAKNKAIARKSIHLNKQLEAGSTISMNDLIMLRPGDGISPMEIETVLQKKIKHALNEGTKLQWSDLQ